MFIPYVILTNGEHIAIDLNQIDPVDGQRVWYVQRDEDDGTLAFYDGSVNDGSGDNYDGIIAEFVAGSYIGWYKASDGFCEDQD
jgi:hypothetical protein